MYRLAILVQRDAAHFDDGLIWFGTRRRDFQDLAFHVQHISRTRWLGPCQIAAKAYNAVAERQTTIYEQAHRDRCRVPPAGCQSSEYGIFCSDFIQVERLRIEFSSELLDLRFIHLVTARDEPLAHVKVFQIQSFSDHDVSFLRARNLTQTFSAKLPEAPNRCLVLLATAFRRSRFLSEPHSRPVRIKKFDSGSLKDGYNPAQRLRSRAHRTIEPFHATNCATRNF